MDKNTEAKANIVRILMELADITNPSKTSDVPISSTTLYRYVEKRKADMRPMAPRNPYVRVGMEQIFLQSAMLSGAEVVTGVWSSTSAQPGTVTSTSSANLIYTNSLTILHREIYPQHFRIIYLLKLYFILFINANLQNTLLIFLTVYWV